ncbi:hypothetical protein KKC1_14960 [Calderihabitans maritimus]|uniref:Uncharacterized protein n=1 Tax=Calderihabitans maritimus TaxID=1246530 RepID=A0A1Z5HSN7_9FIRM|nr:hypothetical protein KKC1_14960 [Calderihabitans maritimus]
MELAFDCFYKFHDFILHHIKGCINCAFIPRLKSRGLRRGKKVNVAIGRGKINSPFFFLVFVLGLEK